MRAGFEIVHVEAAKWSWDLGRVVPKMKDRNEAKRWSLEKASVLFGAPISHDGLSDAMMIGAWGVLKYDSSSVPSERLSHLLGCFPDRRIAKELTPNNGL
jgi:hypothetical protein